jgi:hypothetical protein
MLDRTTDFVAGTICLAFGVASLGIVDTYLFPDHEGSREQGAPVL